MFDVYHGDRRVATFPTRKQADAYCHEWAVKMNYSLHIDRTYDLNYMEASA